MTGKIGNDLNSVLPLDAQAARIAAGGGLFASVRLFPSDGKKPPSGYFQTGQEPDGLDFPEKPGWHIKTATTIPIFISNRIPT